MDSFEGFQTEPMSLHEYLYAHANPVTFVDPSGNASNLTEAIAVVSVVVILASINWVANRFETKPGQEDAFADALAKRAKCIDDAFKGFDNILQTATGVSGVTLKFALNQAIEILYKPLPGVPYVSRIQGGVVGTVTTYLFFREQAIKLGRLLVGSTFSGAATAVSGTTALGARITVGVGAIAAIPMAMYVQLTGCNVAFMYRTWPLAVH